jgi:integrase
MSSRRRGNPGWGVRQIYTEGRDLSDEYECVRSWFLNVSANSQRQYKANMRKFIAFSKLTPDQILELARKDRVAVHTKLKEFWHKLRDDGLSSKTRSASYTAVRSFLLWNELPLGRAPRQFEGKAQYESYRVLESHEIAKMLSHAKTNRDRAIISFLAQSGQRTGIVSAMKYRHVQDELESGVNPIIVNVNAELTGRNEDNTNKGGVSYRFAIGKECASFLRLSIRDRRRKGEQINRESWLFRSFCRLDHYAPDGRPIIVRVKDDQPSPPIGNTTIHNRVLTVAKRAGIDRIKEGTRIHGSRAYTHEIHPHIFRRWWKFQMRKGGVIDSDLLSYMMGHRNTVQRHGGNYDEFDPDYIRREYSKAEPFLTVASEATTNEPMNAVPGQNAIRPEIPLTNRLASYSNAQRVVSEWELDKYLAQGWRYVVTLPSGRIIVGSV